MSTREELLRELYAAQDQIVTIIRLRRVNPTEADQDELKAWFDYRAGLQQRIRELNRELT